MKGVKVHTIASLCLLSCLAACQSEDAQLGQLVPLHIAIGCADADVTVVTRSLPVDLDKPSAQDCKVSVSDGDKEWNEGYGNISSITLPPGTYTVKAWHGDNPLLALNAPYYEGTEENVVVSVWNTTDVGITCAVANALASIEYYDHNGQKATTCFDEQFESGYYVEATLDGAEPVKLAEGQHVYFRAGTAPSFTFHGTRRYDNATVAIPIATSAVPARTHLALHLSVSADGDVISVFDEEQKADNSPVLIRPRK